MRIATALILTLLAAATTAEDTGDGKSYLCTPEQGVAFYHNEETRSWDEAILSANTVGKYQWVIRPRTADDYLPYWNYGDTISTKKKEERLDDYTYGVWELGSKVPDILCSEREGYSDRKGWKISCDGGYIANLFNFNAVTRRFMVLLDGDYVRATLDTDGKRMADGGGYPAFLMIGYCTQL